MQWHQQKTRFRGNWKLSARWIFQASRIPSTSRQSYLRLISFHAQLKTTMPKGQGHTHYALHTYINTYALRMCALTTRMSPPHTPSLQSFQGKYVNVTHSLCLNLITHWNVCCMWISCEFLLVIGIADIFITGKFCLKNDCRLIANTIWFSQPVPNINNKKCSKFLFCVLFKCVYVLKYFTGYKYERQYALTYNVVVTYIHANTNHINYKVHN